MESYKQFFIQETIDGSTFEGWFDLGFDIQVRKKIKLVGLTCNPTTEEERLLVKDYVAKLLKNRTIFCKTLPDKFRKYSTVLVIMYVDHNETWLNVNDHLIEKAFAQLRQSE